MDVSCMCGPKMTRVPSTSSSRTRWRGSRGGGDGWCQGVEPSCWADWWSWDPPTDDGPPAGDVISRNTVLAAWSKSAGVRPGESPSAGEGRSTEEEEGASSVGGIRPRTKALPTFGRGSKRRPILANRSEREQKKPHGGRSPSAIKKTGRVISRTTQPIAAHFREYAAQHTARMGTPHGTEGRKRDTLSRNGSNRGHRNPICRHSRNGVLFGVGPAPPGGGGLPRLEGTPKTILLRSMKEGAYHSKSWSIGRYVPPPTYAHACRWRRPG